MTASRPLPPITPPQPAHQPATSTVRLMVFNAQHASPSRARRQAAWIASQENADLVVVTEVGAGPGGHALTEALGEHGYSSVLAPEPAAPDYRTILASRGPSLTPVPSGICAFPHRGPAAMAGFAGHTVGLLGLYVPSRGPQQRRNESKHAFQDAAAKALPRFLPGSSMHPPLGGRPAGPARDREICSSSREPGRGHRPGPQRHPVRYSSVPHRGCTDDTRRVRQRGGGAGRPDRPLLGEPA